MGELTVDKQGRHSSIQQPGACTLIQPQTMLPSHIMVLVLSNNWLYKMKNSSLSELDLLKRPVWSLLHLDTMLVSVVNCPRCIEAKGS